MSPAVQVDGLTVERGGTLAVDDVTLCVQRASWFGLIGANGSGKTSLLRALAGRLPISSGSCSLMDGVPMRRRHERAACVGFAPPIEMLPGSLKVREVLALAGRSVDGALARMGGLGAALAIETLLERWIGECSAGMRQRVAIACAFAGGQPIVVLDEPFNWLDPVAAFDVKAVLRAMVRDGLTLITALHDLATLVHSCDAGVLMADGRVALELDAAALCSAAGDLPSFEQRMIAALRSSGG